MINLDKNDLTVKLKHKRRSFLSTFWIIFMNHIHNLLMPQHKNSIFASCSFSTHKTMADNMKNGH